MVPSWRLLFLLRDHESLDDLCDLVLESDRDCHSFASRRIIAGSMERAMAA